MAAGDLTVFNAFGDVIGEEVHNMSSDTFKMGLVTNGVTPTADDTTPTWSDYSGSEVSTGGGYPADGITLTTVTWTRSGAVTTFDADNVSLSQDGSGFTNAYWAIIYNDSAASDDAVCFIDLGGPVSEQAGDIAINFSGSGICIITANP
jgi:hypothetical protein